jgi:hypothetical protein
VTLDLDNARVRQEEGDQLIYEAALKAHSLMRRQLKLSIACALAFLIVLLGLPLPIISRPNSWPRAWPVSR